MDAATLYVLLVCAGTAPQICDLPFGGVPSFTRQACLERMMAMRDVGHRVLCVAPDPAGGSRPYDIIDSAGLLRSEWPVASRARTVTLFTSITGPADTDYTSLSEYPSMTECGAAIRQAYTSPASQRRLLDLFCIEGFEDHGWSE